MLLYANKHIECEFEHYDEEATMKTMGRIILTKELFHPIAVIGTYRKAYY